MHICEYVLKFENSCVIVGYVIMEQVSVHGKVALGQPRRESRGSRAPCWHRLPPAWKMKSGAGELPLCQLAERLGSEKQVKVPDVSQVSG